MHKFVVVFTFRLFAAVLNSDTILLLIYINALIRYRNASWRISFQCLFQLSKIADHVTSIASVQAHLPARNADLNMPMHRILADAIDLKTR